jgi:hypothetical protein
MPAATITSNRPDRSLQLAMVELLRATDHERCWSTLTTSSRKASTQLK